MKTGNPGVNECLNSVAFVHKNISAWISCSPLRPEGPAFPLNRSRMHSSLHLLVPHHPPYLAGKIEQRAEREALGQAVFDNPHQTSIRPKFWKNWKSCTDGFDGFYIDKCRIRTWHHPSEAWQQLSLAAIIAAYSGVFS
jgi:hypothetical protein